MSPSGRRQSPPRSGEPSGVRGGSNEAAASSAQRWNTAGTSSGQTDSVIQFWAGAAGASPDKPITAAAGAVNRGTNRVLTSNLLARARIRVPCCSTGP